MCPGRAQICSAKNDICTSMSSILPNIFTHTVKDQSGTTITQIFDQLGKDSFIEDDHWAKRDSIKFYTNSIRGVFRLFKYRDHSSRYSEIPFKCNIFPGKILSPYEAIADEWTVKSILNLKSPNTYIIFVTTGNYLIYNNKDKLYVPIARAGFHPHVKAAGFHVANEVHVIAPLGKILTNCATEYRNETIDKTLDRFNKSLGFKEELSDESRRSYILVNPLLLTNSKDNLLSKSDRQSIEQLSFKQSLKEWSHKSILITTNRESDERYIYWLSKHSSWIKNNLNEHYDPEVTVMPNRNSTPFIISYNFVDLPYSTDLQVSIEIPHENLRNKAILGDFFNVERRQ